jgi:hypothetical protein
MMGLVAAALVSMPMIAAASDSTTQSAHSKATVRNHVWGAFKYKTARHKQGIYGSSRSAPE